MPLHAIRSRIGHAEVVQVIGMDSSPILGIALPEATPEVLKSIPWMKPPYVNDAHSMRAVSQCSNVKIGKRILVVDTCVGNDKNIAGFDAFSNLRLDFLASTRTSRTSLIVTPTWATVFRCSPRRDILSAILPSRSMRGPRSSSSAVTRCTTRCRSPSQTWHSRSIMTLPNHRPRDTSCCRA